MGWDSIRNTVIWLAIHPLPEGLFNGSKANGIVHLYSSGGCGPDLSISLRFPRKETQDHLEIIFAQDNTQANEILQMLGW